MTQPQLEASAGEAGKVGGKLLPTAWARSGTGDSPWLSPACAAASSQVGAKGGSCVVPSPCSWGQGEEEREMSKAQTLAGSAPNGRLGRTTLFPALPRGACAWQAGAWR